MKTPATLAPFESQVLALIAAARGEQVNESAVLVAMFPAPKWPAGAKVGSPEAAEWNRVHRLWQDRAYSGNGIEYRDCYASITARALIRLINLKLIREFNNGFNCGSYSVAA